MVMQVPYWFKETKKKDPTKERCPRCIEMHFEKRYSGFINGEQSFFCDTECRKQYFSDCGKNLNIGSWDG